MKLIANLEDQRHEVLVQPVHDSKNLFLVTVDGHEHHVDAETMLIDGKSYDIDVEALGETLKVRVRGREVYLEMLDERRQKIKEAQSLRALDSGEVKICSPMPGKILRILVSVGDLVESGQGLLVVEAMKMENELKAPKKGLVKELKAQAGQSVDAGALLAVID